MINPLQIFMPKSRVPELNSTIENLIKSRVSLVGMQAELNPPPINKELEILKDFLGHPLRVTKDNRGLRFTPQGKFEAEIDRIITVQDLVTGKSDWVRADCVTLTRDLRDLEKQIINNSKNPNSDVGIPDTILVHIIKSDKNYRASLQDSGLSSQEVDEKARENLQRICSMVGKNY